MLPFHSFYYTHDVRRIPGDPLCAGPGKSEEIWDSGNLSNGSDRRREGALLPLFAARCHLQTGIEPVLTYLVKGEWSLSGRGAEVGSLGGGKRGLSVQLPPYTYSVFLLNKLLFPFRPEGFPPVR